VHAMVFPQEYGDSSGLDFEVFRIALLLVCTE
jgi:hypothetical protein